MVLSPAIHPKDMSIQEHDRPLLAPLIVRYIPGPLQPPDVHAGLEGSALGGLAIPMWHPRIQCCNPLSPTGIDLEGDRHHLSHLGLEDIIQAA